MSDEGIAPLAIGQRHSSSEEQDLERIESWYQYGDFANARGLVSPPPMLNRLEPRDEALVAEVSDMFLRPDQARVLRPILVDALAQAATTLLQHDIQAHAVSSGTAAHGATHETDTP